LLRSKQEDYKDYWLGLWAPSGNTFFYEDNTDLDYSYWAPGKPGTITNVD